MATGEDGQGRPKRGKSKPPKPEQQKQPKARGADVKQTPGLHGVRGVFR